MVREFQKMKISEGKKLLVSIYTAGVAQSGIPNRRCVRCSIFPLKVPADPSLIRRDCIEESDSDVIQDNAGRKIYNVRTVEAVNDLVSRFNVDSKLI
jgi:hypothetical protein